MMTNPSDKLEDGSESIKTHTSTFQSSDSKTETSVGMSTSGQTSDPTQGAASSQSPASSASPASGKTESSHSSSATSSGGASSGRAPNQYSGKFKDKRPEPLKLAANTSVNQEIPLDLSVKSAGNVPSGSMGVFTLPPVAGAHQLIGGSPLETPRIVWQDNESFLIKPRLLSSSSTLRSSLSGGGGGSVVGTGSGGHRNVRLSSLMGVDSPTPPLTPNSPLLELLSPRILSSLSGSGHHLFGASLSQHGFLMSPPLSADSMAAMTTPGLQTDSTGVSGIGNRNGSNSSQLRFANWASNLHRRHRLLSGQMGVLSCRDEVPSARPLASKQSNVRTASSAIAKGAGLADRTRLSGPRRSCSTENLSNIRHSCQIRATARDHRNVVADAATDTKQSVSPTGVTSATTNLFNIHLNSPAASSSGVPSERQDHLIHPNSIENLNLSTGSHLALSSSSTTSNTLNTPTLISPSQLKGLLPSPANLSPISSMFELPSPFLGSLSASIGLPGPENDPNTANNKQVNSSDVGYDSAQDNEAQSAIDKVIVDSSPSSVSSPSSSQSSSSHDRGNRLVQLVTPASEKNKILPVQKLPQTTELRSLTSSDRMAIDSHMPEDSEDQDTRSTGATDRMSIFMDTVDDDDDEGLVFVGNEGVANGEHQDDRPSTEIPQILVSQQQQLQCQQTFVNTVTSVIDSSPQHPKSQLGKRTLSPQLSQIRPTSGHQRERQASSSAPPEIHESRPRSKLKTAFASENSQAAPINPRNVQSRSQLLTGHYARYQSQPYHLNYHQHQQQSNNLLPLVYPANSESCLIALGDHTTNSNPLGSSVNEHLNNWHKVGAMRSSSAEPHHLCGITSSGWQDHYRSGMETDTVSQSANLINWMNPADGVTQLPSSLEVVVGQVGLANPSLSHQSNSVGDLNLHRLTSGHYDSPNLASSGPTHHHNQHSSMNGNISVEQATGSSDDLFAVSSLDSLHPTAGGGWSAHQPAHLVSVNARQTNQTSLRPQTIAQHCSQQLLPNQQLVQQQQMPAQNQDQLHHLLLQQQQQQNINNHHNLNQNQNENIQQQRSHHNQTQLVHHQIEDSQHLNTIQRHQHQTQQVPNNLHCQQIEVVAHLNQQHPPPVRSCDSLVGAVAMAANPDTANYLFRSVSVTGSGPASCNGSMASSPMGGSSSSLNQLISSAMMGTNVTAGSSSPGYSSMVGGGGISGMNPTKKYPCDRCHKSFARSDMLARHKRLHLGDKPFQCSECKQEFSRSDHLSTHMRTHTGEKPYRCKECPYTACRKDMINRHMKVHRMPGLAGHLHELPDPPASSGNRTGSRLFGLQLSESSLARS